MAQKVGLRALRMRGRVAPLSGLSFRATSGGGDSRYFSQEDFGLGFLGRPLSLGRRIRPD